MRTNKQKGMIMRAIFLKHASIILNQENLHGVSPERLSEEALNVFNHLSLRLVFDKTRHPLYSPQLGYRLPTPQGNALSVLGLRVIIHAYDELIKVLIADMPRVADSPFRWDDLLQYVERHLAAWQTPSIGTTNTPGL